MASMTTIKIDNRDYELGTLSDEAKAQLQSLQFVDAELQRLQAQAAVFQTARAAYAKALKEAKKPCSRRRMCVSGPDQGKGARLHFHVVREPGTLRQQR